MKRKNPVRLMVFWSVFLSLAALICVTNLHTLWNYAFWANIPADMVEKDVFRDMDFPRDGLEKIEQLAKKTGLQFAETAAIVMTRYDFSPSTWELEGTNREDVWDWNHILEGTDETKYKPIEEAYQAILSDIQYFPVPDSLNKERKPVTFSDTWKQKRTYGGERLHEGTDIMGDAYERGTYPIVSMTDGYVENMGWLEKGGWRIGIRGASGGYFYYAHLYAFASGLKEGDFVKAGQLLGYMGDSGYEKEEGTVGKFPVHLHFGIYLETEHMEEMSVNPYPILVYAQKYKLNYDY